MGPRDTDTGHGYDKDDAARDTNSSDKDVSQAWHDARDDAQSDSRSSDPNDLGYTGDWKRD